MSIEHKTGVHDLTETEQSVSDYLLTHPDFFDSHTDVLTRLKVPHPSGNAVSLIERQVEVLRQQHRQAERKLVDLIEVARANDALIERIHRLAIALLETHALPERLYALAEELRNRFGADEITLFLFDARPLNDDAGPARWMRPDDAGLEQFRELLKTAKPHCGRLRAPQLEFLFGDQAERISSAALIPLGEHGRLGLLAVGSHEAERFSPTLGTAFLVRIGELVAAAIRPLLPA
ncbi:MAG TPA: DUF484 family protein [Gammaproteobacteria bacterium]|nr:DUF484 family protein [Gammaproteobacteria bacterium]